mmetsp:Transcript_18419/g.37784  ORF Transcript_18419/g.37784 Transcript_18419/m.37784 type:complete len:83 (-) Transcript_18419:1260-1508(-)
MVAKRKSSTRTIDVYFELIDESIIESIIRCTVVPVSKVLGIERSVDPHGTIQIQTVSHRFVLHWFFYFMYVIYSTQLEVSKR